jgi:hypothetical protein
MIFHFCWFFSVQVLMRCWVVCESSHIVNSTATTTDTTSTTHYKKTVHRIHKYSMNTSSVPVLLYTTTSYYDISPRHFTTTFTTTFQHDISPHP